MSQRRGVPSIVGRVSDEQLDHCEELLFRVGNLPDGDPDRHQLRDAVVETLLPMADAIARAFPHGRQSVDDLVQVARLGLVKAVAGFDPKLGGLAGYAVPTIRGELKRYFRDQCWEVRVPRRLQELRSEVRAGTERAEQRLGHTPQVAEIADELQIGSDEVNDGLKADVAYSVASLNAPAGWDHDGCEVGDLVGAPDGKVEQVPERVSLRPALERLPVRERQLIRWRFFDELTQQQIADRLGVSQMHVSRLLSSTLAAIRAWLEGDTDQIVVSHPRRRTGRVALRPAA